MKKRPLLGVGDLVRVKNSDGSLSNTTYLVRSIGYDRRDVGRTRGTRMSDEGYAEVVIRAKGEMSRTIKRKQLWRIPTGNQPNNQKDLRKEFNWGSSSFPWKKWTGEY